MGWEETLLERTLFIMKTVGPKGKTKYSIYPIMRVTNNEGATYLEPLPMSFFAGGTEDVYNFNAVEFIDPPAVDRESSAGDLSLAAVQGCRTHGQS